jgi:Glutamine cyclotransferase
VIYLTPSLWHILAAGAHQQLGLFCMLRRASGLIQMEWVDGEIWGNVWQTECIARIDPATGAVLGWIMLQVAALQLHESLVTAVSLVRYSHDNRTFPGAGAICLWRCDGCLEVSDTGTRQKGARGASTAQAGCPQW